MPKIRYQVFNDMLEGVQVISPEWKYVYVNKTLEAQAKRPSAELINHTMMEMFPGIDQTDMFGRLSDCMKYRVPEVMLNRYEFADGSVGYFELRMQPVPDGVLVLSVDITEQKRLEQDLRKLNEELEEVVTERTRDLLEALESAKRLNELKTQFVTIASHEFKTPLGAIDINVRVLERFNSPPHLEERASCHQFIRLAVKDMFGILNDFLTDEKLKHGGVFRDAATFDVAALIGEEINRHKTHCKPGQIIEYEDQGTLPFFGDSAAIRTILTNLVSNAIKYSDAAIHVSGRIEDGILHLAVQDRGIGIPEKEQKNVFSKFFRAENTGEVHGTGLGLNIVKQYVDILEGKISFTSNAGKGTTFRVQIPQSVDPSRKD